MASTRLCRLSSACWDVSNPKGTSQIQRDVSNPKGTSQIQRGSNNIHTRIAHTSIRPRHVLPRRLKIIPRVVNVDEWAQKAPLSFPESLALRNYNEKPVMSEPQHRFYAGPGYMEVRNNRTQHLATLGGQKYSWARGRTEVGNNRTWHLAT
eukprot:355625-Chlamydomonas_euryale.AAC.1